MRGSVRQFLLILVAASYAVLWTCGSAWHIATCAHLHEVQSPAEAKDAPLRNCGHTHCCHGHEPSENNSDKRGSEAPHEHKACEICQLFAQAIARTPLAAVEASLAKIDSSLQSLLPPVLLSEPILTRPRGPPVG